MSVIRQIVGQSTAVFSSSAMVLRLLADLANGTLGTRARFATDTSMWSLEYIYYSLHLAGQSGIVHTILCPPSSHEGLAAETTHHQEHL